MTNNDKPKRTFGVTPATFRFFQKNPNVVINIQDVYAYTNSLGFNPASVASAISRMIELPDYHVFRIEGTRGQYIYRPNGGGEIPAEFPHGTTLTETRPIPGLTPTTKTMTITPREAAQLEKELAETGMVEYPPLTPSTPSYQFVGNSGKLIIVADEHRELFAVVPLTDLIPAE